MMTGLRRGGLAAPFTLAAGFAALFAIGTVAAGLHGGLPAAGVLVAAAVVVCVMSFVGEAFAALPLGVIGWLIAVGFSRPPYAQLRPTGPLASHAALVMAAASLAGAAAGVLHRSWWRHILVVVTSSPGDDPGSRHDRTGRRLPGLTGEGRARQPRSPAARNPVAMALSALAPPVSAAGGATAGMGSRRRWLGVLLAVVGLPLVTLGALAGGQHLSLTDDLLLYLVVVVGLAVVGGLWPAVLAAVAASLLINWFFTPPVHTFTIGRLQDLLALLLFVTVAVAVSSVVHLAEERAVQAARSSQEAASLLALAQTVLGGADTPAAVLGHLTATLGGYAALKERVLGQWVQVAASGTAPAGSPGNPDPDVARLAVREDLALEVKGQSSRMTPGLLAGFAAQAAAALDRERLRTQAAQAEMLAEGNRMRTALLAAVSHDLRTPLASIKASVSSLRQTDVRWTPADQADLLSTIEENSDRLDGLIANLLDMSRLHTGSLQPFLRPTTVDEVAPVALRGLDIAPALRVAIPDGLPLVLADPGLLERVLANLFSNALAHSPPARPPVFHARRVSETVVMDVIDHGPGVPNGWKQAIFEPFQRFDNRSAGVGLGLAVAKGFTEAMGGSIDAADTPGGGLTVRVTLPVATRTRETAPGANA